METLEGVIQIVKDMQYEYQGRAEREGSVTLQFAEQCKATAMGEFLIRLEHLRTGAHQNVVQEGKLP